MGTRRAKAPAALIVFLVIAFLISASSGFGVWAQTTSPPGTGQVIAHGIAPLPGTPANWRLGVVTAQPGSEAQFGSFDTGFAIGYQEPVITTQLPSGQSTLLEPGDATFHAKGSTLRVASASAVDVAYLFVDLTAVTTDPGASFIGDAFTAPSGTHDVRLTSNILQAGGTDTFLPDNDLPYMVYAFDGALEVTDEDGVVSALMAGDALQLDGTALLSSGASAGARWMIASIGPQVTVPPLPTPVATAASTTPPTPTGSLVVHLLRCPDGTDPLIAPTECVISDIVWDMTIAPQGDDDPAKERTLVTDAVDIGSTSYRFVGLPTGTWVLRPDMSGMGPEQRIEMTGDIIPLGGIWGVEIGAGEEAEVNVYLIDPQEQATTGTGDLIIEMYDCPPGVDPTTDASTCTLAVDAPNVEVSRITQAESIVYNTLWDAVSPDSGTFIFEDIESGTFMLIPEDGGLWTSDWVTMSGDAYWDTGFWQVEVAEGGSAYVAIYHTPAGPPEPTEFPTATGQLWITQVDCPSGTTDPTAEPGCMPSNDPWQVIVTSVGTGDQWTLSVDAYSVAPGSWAFDLPAGEYGVYVDSSGSWIVTYDSFATVTDGGLTEVIVYSIAPGSP